ncbi:related to Diacylglycerol pyrophosphate phosphatase 1 [Saccharomycodes ludwigii]|uniref:Related to Diacylglycerol pyrophosphate phosphatase 1 n=1 Tax=Saccharomycodes ludwigii TaxID=36035 RepID=A0A376B6F1_9ASCO|nr:hypothetical protein SCDLUD_004597 [Saccharomycodes ludwigii]KAH3899168.1 hypothetical protein SCDLUD_004597 [Saccharomycodes ludwigii]SSD60149.1 related to Diacylglycerol pyrophosphate phosphatase 1 [Saccharomycodes ludwigii]
MTFPSVNRLTFGLDRIKTYPTFKKWRGSDVLFLILIVLLNIPVYHFQPFQRQFYINDMTIAHPYADPQTVNDSALALYAFGIPFFTIIILTLLFADPKHKIYLLYISLLGLTISVFLTGLITDYLKNWIGRLRPDFLSRCMPKPGVPENRLVYAKDVCTTHNMDILIDGFRTTPSGHSSESFSGLGYLYFWLCGQLLTEYTLTGTWRKVVASIPLLGASLIALSRTQDYRHHFIDVIIGSILGIVIAHWCYRRNFPSIHSKDPFKPLLDDSGVTLDNDLAIFNSKTGRSGTNSNGTTVTDNTNFQHVSIDEESLPLTIT